LAGENSLNSFPAKAQSKMKENEIAKIIITLPKKQNIFAILK
jgi:hypothetical protein